MRSPSIGYSQRSYTDPSPNLLINYLPGSIEKSQLEKIFAPFGALEHVKTIKSNGTCLGYGFVKFVAINDAIRAEKHFSSSSNVNNPGFKAQFAKPPEKHKQSKESFLTFTSIPSKFSFAEVKSLFERFGPICQSSLSLSDAGWTGTVRLATPSQAQAAVQALNNWTPPGATRAVLVKIAGKPNEGTPTKRVSSPRLNKGTPPKPGPKTSCNGYGSFDNQYSKASFSQERPTPSCHSQVSAVQSTASSPDSKSSNWSHVGAAQSNASSPCSKSSNWSHVGAAQSNASSPDSKSSNWSLFESRKSGIHSEDRSVRQRGLGESKSSLATLDQLFTSLNIRNSSWY